MAGGGGTTTTTSTVDTGPWKNQTPFLMGLFNQAANLDNNNPINAPTSPFTTQGYNTIGQIGSSPSQFLSASGPVLTDTLNGQYLDPNTNPWLGKTYDAAADAVTRAYQTATSPETSSLFAAANRTGSGAESNAFTQNQLNLGRTLDNLGTSIFGGNYSQERQNQMAGLGIVPTLEQAQYIDPTAQANAGLGLQQAQIQQQLQPWQTAQLYQGLISGNYGQNGTTTSQQPYYSNPLGQIAGGLFAAAGTAGQLGWKPFA